MIKDKRILKIGTRVKYIGESDPILKTGLCGTIVGAERWKFNNKNFIINVEFDKNISQHNCDGKAKVGHGWNFLENDKRFSWNPNNLVLLNKWIKL